MNIVVFDVETQRTFDEVGGRQNIRQMGLSAAVTYTPADGTFRHYTEETVADLIAQLKAADLVVGFNCLSFDYEVLRAYTDEPLERLPTVDMLDHVYRALGFRVGLDGLAGATLGQKKSADGLQAVQWFREGRIQDILDYCQQDVDVTWKLYDYGCRNKHVKYRDRRFQLQSCAVSWSPRPGGA